MTATLRNTIAHVGAAASPRPTRTSRALLFLVLFSAMGASGAAFAEEAGGAHQGAEAHAAAADAHAAGGHEAVPSEDHWNVLTQFAPHLVDNVRAMWGKTWLKGEAMPSRTMHVFIGVFVFLLSLGIASMCAAKFRREGEEAVLPEKTFGWFTVFELAGEWLYKSMIDTMGKEKARYFFPLIFSLATYIVFSNLIGLVPGFVGSTDNLNTTLPIALVVFVTTHVYGVQAHGFGAYIGHFFGPMRGIVWLPLMLLMFLIEIVSHLARPASLAIRLMGNMFGDHMVLGVFLSFMIPFVPLPIMVLGTLVCVVQTLVFCLLSMVYIALAVEHSEGDHGHSSSHSAH